MSEVSGDFSEMASYQSEDEFDVSYGSVDSNLIPEYGSITGERIEVNLANYTYKGWFQRLDVEYGLS